MFLLTLLACGSTYDPYAPRADCISVTTAGNGVVTTREFDGFGWPVTITVDRGNGNPVVTTVEYERVAGDVREARFTTGEVVVYEAYDAGGKLRESETNLFGVPDVSCSLTYEGDVAATSVCDNGVETVFDPCGEPLEILTPDYAEAFTNTYLRCQPQGKTVEGVDRDGDYTRNLSYDGAGRPVTETTRRGNRVSSVITEWTCP